MRERWWLWIVYIKVSEFDLHFRAKRLRYYGPWSSDTQGNCRTFRSMSSSSDTKSRFASLRRLSWHRDASTSKAEHAILQGYISQPAKPIGMASKKNKKMVGVSKTKSSTLDMRLVGELLKYLKAKYGRQCVCEHSPRLIYSLKDPSCV